ncbi:hypothetical protein pb186bvf_017399 [Paramecium bursaria]
MEVFNQYLQIEQEVTQPIQIWMKREQFRKDFRQQQLNQVFIKKRKPFQGTLNLLIKLQNNPLEQVIYFEQKKQLQLGISTKLNILTLQNIQDGQKMILTSPKQKKSAKFY